MTPPAKLHCTRPHTDQLSLSAERGKKTINLKFNQPSSAPASRFSCVCVCLGSLCWWLWSCQNGINKHFYTTSHVYDQRRQPPFLFIGNLRGQQIAVFPRGSFLEGMDCHVVLLEKKKLESLNNDAPGTHPSFFFFPCQIELLEDISRERKGCFLLQPECAISWKPVVSIALCPRRGKPVKKSGDSIVEDKGRDGDGLLMDSTVPHCQFPFLIGDLF